MSIVYTTQYHPITTLEQDDTEALSSRHYRDQIHNVNNLTSFVKNTMLIPGQFWDGTGLRNRTGSTAEEYLCQWAPVPFPLFFSDIRFRLWAYRVAGAGNVQLRLYADNRAYHDTNAGLGFSQFREFATVQVGSATGAFYVNTITDVPRGGSMNNPRTHLIMTAEPSTVTAQVRVDLLTAWAEPLT